MEQVVREIRPNGRTIFHLVEIMPEFHYAFMGKEDLREARENRQRQRPIYPDMRQPTDESKKMLRRKKGGDSK